MSTLATYYDSNAESLYTNFSISLQQVACNATDSAKYSLSRTCDDCNNDYKTWLCAVTIPHCADLSSSSSSLMPRNVGQKLLNGSSVDATTIGLTANDTMAPWYSSSRMSLIDVDVKPGPYKENLPCIELCYELVKSCPAVLGFACPRQEHLLNKSYGVYDATRPGSCNFLGRDPPSINMSPGMVGPLTSLILLFGTMHLMLVWI